MANYKDSFKKVILAEGGYTNDPDDSGGETYLGITRVHEPKSIMWPIVDKVKAKLGYANAKTFTTAMLNNMTKELNKDETLLDEARRIYKKDYWDKIRLDEIPSDKIAHQLFDHAVNAGVGASIKIAEELVGLPLTSKLSNALIDKLKVL